LGGTESIQKLFGKIVKTFGMKSAGLSIVKILFYNIPIIYL